jgi:low affinity Fe/Cu permease
VEGPDHPEDHAAYDERSRSPKFRSVAERLTAITGSGTAAAGVAGAFVVWFVVGVATGYPRWWELCATAGLPFLTLVMLVMIQHTQNHDDRATQLKLDELIRASTGATNRMMTVEDASPDDLDKIRGDFREAADSAGTTTDS